MGKEKHLVHLFYGIVPLFLYFGISMLVVMTGAKQNWTADILNLVNGLLNLAVLYVICYREYNKRGGSREIPAFFSGQKTGCFRIPLSAYIWIFLLGACSCVALNNWFSALGLFQKIQTYDKVAESIYYGSLWMIFVRTAILAPLVEEILVRGMIYRGISCVIGRIPGMAISALIFALMHGNLLQGLYAFILGILFSYIYDLSGRNILAPVLAHFAANLVSVSGTMIVSVSEFLEKYFYILTGLTTILMIIAAAVLYHVKKESCHESV